MKYILFVIAFVMFLGCEKDERSVEKPDAFYSTVMEFAFKNKSGNDMLDPDTPEAFDHSLIETFIMKSGSKEVITNGSSNLFSKERGFYTLLLNLTNQTTYLKLSETTTDTIVTEIKSGSNFAYITKLWYNGELVYNDETALITVVK